MRRLLPLLLALPAPVLADVPADPDPAVLSRTFGGEPVSALGIAVAVVLYAAGSRRLRAGRRAAFFAGIGVLAAALFSPIEAVAGALFTGHMVQHLLLVLVAPPLLVAGAPWASLLRALPAGPRRALNRLARPVRQVLFLPLVAGVAHTVALWIWHAPGLYEAALWDRWIHLLEHACFLGTALVFWSVVRRGVRVRAAAGPALLLVFGVALQATVLGALLCFSPRPLYPSHVAGAVAFGLTPLEDQQLAALLMWVPGNFVYVGAALVVLAGWLVRSGGAAEPAIAAGALPGRRTPREGVER